MGFQLSPGVNVSEIDLTTVIPAVSTTAGATVGEFVWGPINKRILVDSEITLVDRFGKPDSNSFVSFFSAANFLAYGNNLRVVRVANNTSYNATSNLTSRAAQIDNEDDYELNFSVPLYSAGVAANNLTSVIYARYPGALGNSLAVSILGANSNTQLASVSNWTASANATGGTIQFSTYFGKNPGTSIYAAAKGSSNDEIHVVVFDTTGQISGTPGTVLETYSNLSVDSGAKLDDGTSNYYADVIFQKSKWIYIGQHLASNWGTSEPNTAFQQIVTFTGSASANAGIYTGYLSNGATATTTTADYTNGWDLFGNADEVDVSLLVSGNAVANTTIQQKVATIAINRKDCVAFLSPDSGNAVNNPVNTADDIVAYKNSLLIDTSYAFMDSGWKYQFDKYNNVYRFVPLNGDTAGLCVNTDNVRDPWWSPAGFNRGQVKNVVKLSWNPTKTDRDTIYQAGVNPVVAFPGQGVILFGDKTMQSKPSAFDRINVRRLFIVLEKAIAIAAKYSLFEFNDEFTRAQFVALVEPFLRDVKGRRGIYDYRVVCDTTNNTPEVIDSNRFVGDIYIKPARSINFIQLNFIAVRTGVEFSEIVGKF